MDPLAVSAYRAERALPLTRTMELEQCTTYEV